MQAEHFHLLKRSLKHFSISTRQNEAGVLLQESPLAGFNHYRGLAIWPFLSEGEPLALVRETINVYDSKAVAVYFRNEKLGYVPQRENHVIAQMLDRGQRLTAHITRLRQDQNPWRRVHFEVKLVA